MSSSHNENMLETNNKELIRKKSPCAWKLETTFMEKKKKRNTLPYDPWVKEELNGNYYIF